MQKLLFTSSQGHIAEFSNRAPFILSKIDGLGDVQADIKDQKAPFQDGSTYIDSTLTERYQSLEISILANNKEDLLKKRAYIASVFNPKLGQGTLRYENRGIAREIKATSEHVPIFPSGWDNRGQMFQKALIDLKCHDPFWLDPHIESEPMSAWIGGMEFPFTLPVEFAMKSSSTTLLNDGDVEVPVEIVFHGPAVNPIVTNKTTGEFIRVKRTLGANDKLIVRTAFGNKTVLIIDGTGKQTRAFNWLDENSIFWQLDVGYNEIEYNMDSNSEDANVVINWRKRYVGV
ncbi:phage tail family protein [Bacillus sp. FJAT-49705]|uniref:Phage tail family protein n=1 Tax=Cytobacillus citreus TaxID=2833586 RepID=A0ABS5NLG8_9BACI|nr:phage tail family protein [Cytobacillus citreus]MBS4188655.1 phage tail family protein [Cytobacillus citreus]